MSINTSNTDQFAATSTDEDEDGTATTYVKGSWQDNLHKSSALLDRSTKARKQASGLLWTGAQTGIEEWLPGSDTDVSGENLYNDVLGALGKTRKGDASKIKSVALAVKKHGLVLSLYPNLSKAYGEATRLTKTVQAQATEDAAAEKAIESIEAPKTTGSVEGAAALLLSKGLDGAVVAILDALGANNEAAHRAFMRAVATEVAARVQASKPKPAPRSGPKTGATQAATGGKPRKAATVQPAKPKQKGKPVAAKATAPTAEAPAEAGPVNDGVETSAPAPKAKARPVVKRPGRPVAV